jgi:hypothetical protein
VIELLPHRRSRIKIAFLAVAIATLALFGGGAARADAPALSTVDTPSNIATLRDKTFAGATGVLEVNETAGSGNAQANVTVLTRGSGKTTTSITQHASGAGVAKSTATISDAAFSGASGMLQINQSAGFGNAQVNAADLRIGVTSAEMNDAELAKAALPVQVHLTSDSSQKTGSNAVSSARTALSNTRGLVQVNQSAGSNNSTSNTFLLQLQQGSIGGH